MLRNSKKISDFQHLLLLCF